MLKKVLNATIAFAVVSIFIQKAYAAPVVPVVKAEGVDINATNVHYKIGNTYEINGISYTPKKEDNYDAIVVASWYGEDFHGKHTSNGEIYDMNLLTAAHPTLPLPSIVEITNLSNGKKVIVRVNDRGPFKEGRTLDVSKRAAEILGFKDEGTAEVRVRILPAASKVAIERLESYNQQKLAVIPVVSEEVNSQEPKEELALIDNKEVVANQEDLIALETQEDVAPITIESQSQAINKANILEEENPDNQMRVINLSDPKDVKSYVPRGVFVQLGAFSENNNNIKAQLGSLSSLGAVNLQKVDVKGNQFVRLRVGPYGSIEDAIKIKNKLVKLGYTSSRVIVQQ